jgi:hypothetical protein
MENLFFSICSSSFIKIITANKGQLEAPSPNMAGCRGALLATCSEPEAGDMLQVGVLK